MSETIFLVNGISDVTSKLVQSQWGLVKADFQVGKKTFRLAAVTLEYDLKPDDVKYFLEKLAPNGYIETSYRVYRDTFVLNIEVYPVYL
ncbi:hypothetical protein DFQ26_001231 [Actinomortierella ambigua]|nr:hypothetical protein DFQ26_001231 [Actinomortierella ambigua]